MATTIGIKLFHGDVVTNIPDITVENGIPKAGSPLAEVTATTQIKGVQNIPELQTAPSSIDTTSLEDYEEQSEPGLISGSSLAITMNYKVGVYTPDAQGDGSNFQQCLNISNDDSIRPFKIVLPNGRWFLFFAKARTTIGAMGIAAATQFTLSLYKKSKVYTGYIAPSNNG